MHPTNGKYQRSTNSGQGGLQREIENKKDFYERAFKKENSSGFVKGTSSSLKPLMFASLQGYEGQPFPDDDVRISGII